MKTGVAAAMGRKVLQYSLGISGLRRADVWLPSFPKAGSTWVRFLMCNLLSLTELNGRTVDFHVVGEIMPSLGRSNLLTPWPYKSIPRLVKTHQPYRPVLFSVPAHAVYVMRDPRDVMVSYYHYQQSHRERPFAGPFEDFIRDERYGLRACIKHYHSWLPHSTIVVRYEALKEDAIKEFCRILSALDVGASEALVHAAVERSDFKTAKSLEEKTRYPRPERFGEQFQAVRKGKAGQWEDYFTDEDLAYYDKVQTETSFSLYPVRGRT
jgi:estrone sulfotransferase